MTTRLAEVITEAGTRALLNMEAISNFVRLIGTVATDTIAAIVLTISQINPLT